MQPPSFNQTAYFSSQSPEDEAPLGDQDRHWLRQSFVWANAARARGNRPFGAIVVAEDGRILAEAFSNSRETGDRTGHAEMNAVRQLSNPLIAPEVLAKATLYASAEPCAMCAGAICNVGIGRVIYGLDVHRLLHIRSDLRTSAMSCHEIFDADTLGVECIGPALIQEALAVYEGSWLPVGLT